jgi:hypothetical protein
MAASHTLEVIDDRPIQSPLAKPDEASVVGAVPVQCALIVLEPHWRTICTHPGRPRSLLMRHVRLIARR